ncbi:hypothetical protein QFZ34_004278 [Phyllobacterium ifriqiyense]|jgi:hypothetical protein|uniref:Uncharacterized protein n=1 Tax=Phyllobacterium ifriqiyense TaxID=314238 RepID=A0ABU0SF40_9HYPH|nr:hypothetical protein [Phyllobacterium ifriqiyense]MDQ0999096.1 hypothetical protein [Phyllobacterium ifriqiyense]
MKMVLRVVAALLIIAGCIWTLQGLSLIGGSFMVGQTRWLVIGLCTMIMGALLLIFLRRQ